MQSKSNLSSLGCTQVLIDAAKTHFHGAIIPPSYLPSDQCASRWPILSAWHWLVRIPAKEAVLNALPVSDSDTSEPESPMDLAYRCVLLSPIGYAIHKIEVPRVSEPTIEDVATILDALRMAKEAEYPYGESKDLRSWSLLRLRWGCADCVRRCVVVWMLGKSWLRQPHLPHKPSI